ncbi:extracellular solute-binding protein family 1 [Beutenbergia cavernae DSM 12333]|uniref:Extracellular solute-binding protein family 1 n=1 Tax=Beutenbergia cavernae (strain ATCC BAA-8 / DSM 12333 / CCUG 43141 / JCM 11478 / NBRC 16432 / NCIMB 13614 / HKI 0122) TaxID=471853 RepID=C5C379_BEUC1|nr:ABC transporter substrate-binding protein [Beutenbergia cavernae]ACQ79778.1 extracellular solute-binding protein family 1 [Beutenbergia cavernae DSM 12333]
MSKLIRVAALAAAGALTLAACASGGGDAGDDGGQAGPVEITFWNGFTSSDRPIVEQLVAEFNDSQDDYRVRMEIQPWDTMYSKLMPAYQAGEGPTLVAMDPARTPAYVERGVLAPVDDFYGDGALDAATLPEASLEANMYDGVQYGVPMSAGAGMLYWNADIFAAAGIEGPPETWAELADVAVQLTEGDQYGLPIADHEALSLWPTLFWADGGGIFTDDSSASLLGDDATVATMEFWTDLVQNEGISPAGLSGADADALMLAGSAAMHMTGPWLSSGLTEAGINWEVAPLPAGTSGQFSPAVIVNMHLDANATDAEREAARAFVTHWNSPEAQTTWAVGTSYPPNRTDIPASDLAENPTSAAFTEAIGPRFYQAGLLNFADLDANVVTPTIQRVLAGEGTAADLFPEAAEQLDSQIETLGE